ncbi:superoxide dismutase [Arthrobacter sp. AQ5-06]|nr:superoxide dismutase [Arthrobacter sp. AQ5-06]
MKQQHAGAVLVLTALGLFLAGCSSPSPAGTSSPSAPPTTAAPPASSVEGTFAAWAEGNVATTYNPALVPVGAKAQAAVTVRSDGTEAKLTVNGLVPARHYGAHAHVKPCGADGAAAGPHYQDQTDPVTPSVDPAYANMKNEIWLDFETDGSGNASAESAVAWKARADGARSITIHEMHTITEPGKAGTAGSRLACINVDFAP